MHQHGEPVADVGDTSGTVGREIDLASVLVGPHAAVGQPETEDERRITQRARQRRPHLPGLDLAELDDQVGHRRARPPCQPQTERRRRRREPDRDVPDVPEPALEKRLSVEHVDEDVDVLEGVHHDEHGEEGYEPASRTGAGPTRRAMSTVKTRENEALGDPPPLPPPLEARPAVADVEVRRHLCDAVIHRDARGHEQQERREERERHHPDTQPDAAGPRVPQPAGREHEQHQRRTTVPQHVEEEQRDGQPRMRKPVDEVLEKDEQDRVGDEQRPDDVPRPPHPEEQPDGHLGRQ